MFKILPFIAILFLNISTSAQTNSSAKDSIELKEKIFDFGKIVQGKPVFHDFVVTNKSNKSIVINDISTSCGCTTPTWEKKPIMPNESSTINVGFNAGTIGHFDKKIYISYNNIFGQSLSIVGEVYERPKTSIPQNKSIQLLNSLNY